MNIHVEKEIKEQRKKLIKYIRINGYRIIFGITAFLIGSAIFMAWVGNHYHVTMIVSAMIFVFIAFGLAFILGIALLEIFVLKVKKYSDKQVSETYETLVNIEKKKRLDKSNN